ncbi:MAG TPA: amino acid permease [Pyrinomonadaceae bacterium]|nr:amino acid permease [Pyrinomonadaceae bacterium]
MSDKNLIRGIGRWDLTAIAINAIIGAGIFGLPSKVAALIGPYSLIAFVACALIIGLIVLCYAEVSSRFQTTGGPYLYAREAFGPVVGFEVGWLYWIVRITTFAANCNLFVTYLGFFFPAAAEPAVRISIISAVVMLLTAVNFVGVRQSAVATNIFTVGKIVPLVVFCAVGLFFIQPEQFTFAAVPEYGSFASAVLLLIYAFVGFEVAVIPAGEIKEPEKNVPFAIAAALGIVALLYILIQVVSIGTLPGIATSERPLADAATVFLGVFGGGFITIGALISITGNLNVGLLSASRLLFAMADQNELPPSLARTHPKFKTPYVSILLTAALTLIFTVQSSFVSALTIATITRLLVYATTCLAVPVFRTRSDIPAARFKNPLGNIAAFLSLGLIVWLLTNVDFKREGLAILITAVVGLVVFLAVRYFGKQPGDPSS